MPSELDTLVQYYYTREDLNAEEDRRRADFWAWRDILREAREKAVRDEEARVARARRRREYATLEERERRKAEKDAEHLASLSEKERGRILKIRRWKRVNALDLCLANGLSFNPDSPREVEQKCHNFEKGY